MLKVGYFGEPGSFSNAAAEGHFGLYEPNLKVEFLSFTTVEELLEFLAQHKVDEAIVPIENSIEGTVTFMADALISIGKIKITGEVALRIRHMVIGVGSIGKAKEIISHPQALGQCRKNIRKLKISTRIVNSTSAAVKEVAEKNDSAIVAIGSVFAFEIYKKINPKLKILAENFQDVENNWTRFLIMGHEKKQRTFADKTSIVVSPDKNIPGALYQILGEFANRGIDLTKTESRPTKKGLGDYVFYIDLKGHRDDRIVKDAFSSIRKERLGKLKILGSYPRAE